MADAMTTFSTLSNDAPNVYIARRTFRLAERDMVLGKFATRYELPQRTGKTLRVTRPRRLALPTTTLTEGVPPDAVALSIENVDVTVEQWGLVVLLTDVAQITTVHPALQIAIERSAAAMSEMFERELGQMLLGGTQVFFPGAITNRGSLAATDKITTAVVLKATTALRAQGAASFEGGLYGGVMSPQQEGDILGSDVTFQQASNFANVRRLEEAEIGVWMGVRWMRGNFLPVFKGVVAPTTAAATTDKAQITAVDGGGTITSATNFKFAVVGRDANSGLERKISATSADIASAATGNNESFTVALPTSTNYVYDVYMTVAGGAGNLFRVKSSVTGTTTITAAPLGTEAVLPVAPASTGVEVFVAWIFGKDSHGRVELNGMSLESYITPDGATWSNPLAQGRKVGHKVMWKSWILDNTFFARIESGSTYSAMLPA